MYRHTTQMKQTAAEPRLPPLAVAVRRVLSPHRVAANDADYFAHTRRAMFKSIDYDPAGNLKRVTLPNLAYLDYGYDDAHRLTDVRDQLNNHIHYTLDGLGNRTQIDTTDPAGTLRRAHTNHYWTSNQLKDSDDAANPSQGVAPGVTRYMKADGSEGYDANGNRTQVQDAESRRTQIDYDAYNRVQQVTDAKQGTAKYSYDANHRIQTVADPNNVSNDSYITRYRYDGLGNVTSTGSVAGLTQFTAYDGAGNVLTRIDGRNKTTTYIYDALNRIDLVTYADLSTADYVYDIGANAMGRLTSIVDSSGSTGYLYDLHGRVTSKTQAVGSVILTMSYSYDAQGQLDTVTYPSGKKVKYSYLNGVASALSVDGVPLLTNMSYEPFGLLSAWNFGNGAAVSRQYDLDGRLRNYTLGSGTRTLDYTPVGNVWHVLDPTNAANDQTYGYVELTHSTNRLTRYQGFGDTMSYGYDANGNRYSARVNDWIYRLYVESLRNRLRRVDDPLTRTLTRTYSYDGAGNLTDDNQHTYGYDDRGRYTSLDIAQALYSINTQGLRVKKVVNLGVQPGDANGDGVLDALDRDMIANAILGTPAPGKADCNGDRFVTVQDLVCLNLAINSGTTLNGTRLFAYDEAGHLRGEYDQTGAAIQEYVWFGEQPLAVLKGAAVFNVYTDHLNTPRLIADQANKTLWSWDADPFGTTVANEDPDGDGMPFSFNLRFPGQYFDRESKLHYNYFRTYDPSTGRYLESDPVGLSGGLNPYVYANNNPLRYIDPAGLNGIETLYMDDDAPFVVAGRAFGGLAALAQGVITGDEALKNAALEGLADSSQQNIQSLFVLGTMGRGTGACSGTKGGARAPDFIVSPGGTAFPVPKGASGPFPADSGKGFKFTGGSGGNGLSPRTTDVRIMDPVTSGKYQYPSGYGSYGNGAKPVSQTVNPLTGQTIAPSDPWWHIPMK